MDACDEFGDLIRDLGLDRERALVMREEIDIGNVRKLGFSFKHFPNAMVQAYEMLSDEKGLKHDSKTKEKIAGIGNSVITKHRDLFPGVRETLEGLKEAGYPLVLMTAGENEVQEKKIKDAKVGHLFDATYIVPKKDIAAYLAVMSELSLGPGEAFMIGNSLRSDVLPALEVGLGAIHISYKIKSWDYENIDEKQLEKFNGRYHTASCIAEVPSIIKKLESRSAPPKAKA